MKILFTLILFFSYTSFSQDWSQLGSSILGEATGDYYGGALAITPDGSKMIVGGPQNDDNGLDAGHVRIFQNISNSWVQLGANINGAVMDDQSGQSVSISDNGLTVAIGSHASDIGAVNAGQVRVFEYVGGNWIQKGLDINGLNTEDRFSYSALSLSADGNILAVGAKNADVNGTDAGQVRIFEYTGSNWTQKGNAIDGEAANDLLGTSVSLSLDGLIVAIGSTGNDAGGSNAGDLKIFEFSGSTWIPKGNPIKGQLANTQLGWSNSISDNGLKVAVSSIYSDGNGTNSGHTAIYEFIASDWIQLGSMINGQNALDSDGYSVCLSGNGSTVVIGSKDNDDNGINAGQVRAFEYITGVWVQKGSDIEGASSNNALGYAVSTNVNGSLIAIGVPLDGSAGHAEVYQFCNPTLGTDTQTACGSYTWIDGITYNTSNNTATDTLVNSIGCDSIVTLNLTINPLPTFSLTTTNTTCVGSNDGQLNLSLLQNGVSYTVTYKYLGSFYNYSNTASGGIINVPNLDPGAYSDISVVNNSSGCQSTVDVGPYGIIEPTAITITPISDIEQCQGAGDITLNGTASGGSGSFTYTWNNGITDGTPFTPTVGTTPYNLTATDISSGCNTTALYTNIIIEPSPVFTASLNLNPVTCGGTEGAISISGLSNSTSYILNYDFNGTPIGNTSITTGASGAYLINNLTEGTYNNFNVTSITTNSCTSAPYAGSVILTDPTNPTINTVSDYTYCPQVNTTPISFSGTAGASFTWSNNNVSINLNPNGSGDISSFTTFNASSNTEIATIIVTPELNNCTGIPITFNITVNPLDDASFTYTSQDFCLNEVNPSPTVTTLGGTMSYTILGGGPMNLISSTGIINLALSSAGTYDITYSTNGNCPNSSTQTINLFDTPVLTATNPTLCLNSNSLNLDGTVNPFGGNYSGLNIQNNTFNTSGVALGTYSYSYIYLDPNGCSETAVGSITVNDVPTISLVTTNATCSGNNGAIDATITSGIGISTLSWSSGQTTEDINTLTPNNYYLTATDNNGCYAMEVATVSSSEITLSGNVTDNLCPNLLEGTIDLTVIGSTGPYIYYWSNGETTEDISNLATGQYEVFVTDQSNCTSTMSFNVTEPTQLGVSLAINNPSACGVNDGSLVATTFGGTPLYNYEWLDQNSTILGNTSNLAILNGGIYTLNITDDNGCTFSSSAVLTNNGGPVITLSQNIDASCDNDGEIDVNVSSPNAIQSYLWNNAETTEDITNLPIGDYNIVVTDINGCQGYFSTTVNPILPDITNICIVTVDTATNTNLVVWEKPVTTEIDYYVIFRETSVANEFLPVDTVQYEDLSQFTDPIAYPQIRSWRYKIKSVNTCGVSSHFGDIHKTIHMTINAGLGGAFNLNWDEYEGFNYSTFDIWRHTDIDGWGTMPIQSVTNSQFAMSDTPPTENGLDYIIEITPPNTCTSTIKAIDHNSSRSNRSSTITAPAGGPNTNSLTENNNNFNVSVFPNPSNGKFNITILSDINKQFNVSVFNMNGKIITSFQSENESILIDLNKYENGLYILEINTGNNVIRKQLLKQ